jgi:NADH:ubiquinone oxidoreductase subunit 5 (subunit L)/multisubunit Na+/H+ antiporter MnhA subunit
MILVIAYVLFLLIVISSNFYMGALNQRQLYFILIFFIFWLNFSFYFYLCSQLNFFNMGVCFFFSKYTFWFFLVVSLICISIVYYIIVYFSSFFFTSWFFFMFFTFFLAILVYLINFNYFFLFICWELMGVCSFFLITSFYFRFKSRFASFVALFWNLSGDVFLLFFILIILILFKWLSFYIVYFYLFLGLLYIISVFCKWAIFPFHAWLFYAMEGPTPVSAFLHAASMITAGVYLFFLLPFYIWCGLMVLIFFSILFFSFFALFFFDLKRIIASSTGSQMGYILFFLSFNSILNGLLLFTFHAMFKSLLFFIAGYIVVQFWDFQDFRTVLVSPSWFIFFFLCSSALLGVFYLWCGWLKEVFLFFSSLSGSFIFYFLFLIMYSLSFLYVFRWCWFLPSMYPGFCIFFFIFFLMLSTIYFIWIYTIYWFFYIWSFNLSYVFFIFISFFFLFYFHFNFNLVFDMVFKFIIWQTFIFVNYISWLFSVFYFAHFIFIRNAWQEL